MIFVEFKECLARIADRKITATAIELEDKLQELVQKHILPNMRKINVTAKILKQKMRMKNGNQRMKK